MKKYLLIFYLLVNAFSLLGQEFKVVGYLPYYRFDIIENIDFEKITHLNLAFLNPDIDGNLSIGGWDIDPIVLHARSKNPELKVFISLAGGGVTEEWSKAYDKFLMPEHRSEFAHLLVEYVQHHELDGIDVDLEWSHVNEYYSPFVIELADSLRSHGKEISAALPGTHRYADLSEEALDAYDFINLMAYDKTGPWRPNDPGPHSPREFAVQSIAFWRSEGLEDARMTLGVPFYGYDFTNQSNVTAFTFGSLTKEDENLAYKDQDGQRYYNGIPTIQYKTYYALNQVSGIMIWELGQDAFGANSKYSLLSAIDLVVTTGILPVTGVDEKLLSNTNHQITIYPNPFQNQVTFLANHELRNCNIKILDTHGRIILSEIITSNSNERSYDFSEIPMGVYILSIEINGEILRKKLLKN